MNGVEGRDKQNQRITLSFLFFSFLFLFFFSQNEQDGSRVSASPMYLETPRFLYSRLSKVSKDVEDGQVLEVRDEAGESGWR